MLESSRAEKATHCALGEHGGASTTPRNAYQLKPKALPFLVLRRITDCSPHPQRVYAMAQIPQCELKKEAAQFAQTYVAKLSPGSHHNMLRTWLDGQLVVGAAVWALVRVQLPECEAEDLYAVLTERAPHRVECRSKAIQDSIAQLPGQPRAEWVRPLTRRLQRLFRWGDAAATRADVVRATKAGDVQELQAILPKAPLVEQDDLSAVPALFDAIRN